MCERGASDGAAKEETKPSPSHRGRTTEKPGPNRRHGLTKHDDGRGRRRPNGT
jgi:hypothetical protein